MRIKHLLACVMSAAVMLSQGSLLPKEAFAENVVSYNANEFAPFKGRTQADIAQHYSEAMLAGDTYRDGVSSTYYSTPCSTVSPYEPGVVSQDTLDVMLAMTNFYRWLTGTKEITAACQPDESLQLQALVRYFCFAHNVTDDSKKPADMSDEMWNAGKPPAHNILAKGFTPQGAIRGWINEGYDLATGTWSSRGHRWALIDPTHSTMRFGYVGNVAIGAYGGTGSGYTDTFTAYPMPGAMPAEAVYRPNKTSWSAEWEKGSFSFDSLSSVKVTIKNLTTGQTYVRTSSEGTLVSEASNRLEFVQAEDYNTSTNQYDCPYEITITGLKDKNGNAAKIGYSTEFFNVSELSASRVASAGTAYQKLHISSKWDTPEGYAKIGAGLPRIITVKTESGKVYTVPARGAWIYDSDRKCFKNSADPADLPELAVDTFGLLDEVVLDVEIDDSYYTRYVYLNTSPTYYGDISEGSELLLKPRRYISNYNASTVCRVFSDGSGGFDGGMVCDTLLTPGLISDGEANPMVFKAPSCAASDSGEYFSVSYSTNSYYKDAYLSYESITVNIVHKYTSEQTRPASCTEDGIITYTCSVCGHSYTETVTAAGHLFNTVTVPAGCTAQGCKLHTCLKCGESYSDSFTPALGHSYSSRVTKAATCTADGVRTFTCSACGDIYTEPIYSTGHSYEYRITAPTCTSDGFTTYTCSVCGESYKDNIVTSPGHCYVPKVLKEATCTSAGLVKYTCSECGESYTSVIPAEEHDFVAKKVAPTCTEDGYTLHTCSKCGEEYKDSRVSALGHRFVPKVTTEATCTEDGVRTFTCSECGESYTTPIPAEGHHYLTAVVPATCEHGGYTVHTCAVCGDEYTDGVLPALISLENAKISVGHSRYEEYDAAAISDSITVTLGDKQLADDVDITVTVSKPDRSGYVTVTAEGIGEYGGTAYRKVLVTTLGSSFLLGDTDRSGKVDLFDYGLMRVYVLTNPAVNVDLIASDIDNDGEVDETDLILMQAFMAGAGMPG